VTGVARAANRLRVNRLPAICVLVLVAPGALAHRLDEYLQATQISVGRDRIVADIYLTPGTAVAPAILSTIDKNGDGSISGAEGADYGQSVVKSVRLLVDDKPRELSLSSSEYPPMDQMRAGIGFIHLEMVTQVISDSEGAHKIEFQNNFNPRTSVYLANAMIPPDRIVKIRHQQRDVLQRYLKIDYEIGSAGPAYPDPAWLLLVMAAAGLFRYGLHLRRKPRDDDVVSLPRHI
jgi:hypothetical protein